MNSSNLIWLNYLLELIKKIHMECNLEFWTQILDIRVVLVQAIRFYRLETSLQMILDIFPTCLTFLKVFCKETYVLIKVNSLIFQRSLQLTVSMSEIFHFIGVIGMEFFKTLIAADFIRVATFVWQTHFVKQTPWCWILVNHYTHSLHTFLLLDYFF